MVSLGDYFHLGFTAPNLIKHILTAVDQSLIIQVQQHDIILDSKFSKTCTYLDIIEMQMIAICYKSNSDRGILLAMFPARRGKEMSELNLLQRVA